jgi:hypothetical protein
MKYDLVPKQFESAVTLHLFNGGRQDSEYTYLNATLYDGDEFVGGGFSIRVQVKCLYKSYRASSLNILPTKYQFRQIRPGCTWRRGPPGT